MSPVIGPAHPALWQTGGQHRTSGQSPSKGPVGWSDFEEDKLYNVHVPCCAIRVMFRFLKFEKSWQNTSR